MIDLQFAYQIILKLILIGTLRMNSAFRLITNCKIPINQDIFMNL